MTTTENEITEGAAEMTPDARAKSAVDAGKITKKSKEPQDAVSGNGGVVTPDENPEEKSVASVKATATTKKDNSAPVKGAKGMKEAIEDEGNDDISVDDQAQETKAVKMTKHEMTSALLKKFAGFNHSELSTVYTKHFDEEVSAEDTEVAKITEEEDLGSLFNESDLTEETKEKISTIFEAAVQSKVTVEKLRIEEELSAQFEELSEEFTTELTESVDKYLNHVAEEFIKENAVAIEHGLKVDVAEEFISDLKGLFEKHNVYLDIDASKEIDDLNESVEDLKLKIKDSTDKEIDLKEEIKSLKASLIFNSLSEDLADTEIEKFADLSEGVEFVDEESYMKKLNIIKENYFKKSSKSASDITEEVVQIDESFDGTNMVMNTYTAAISKKH